MDNEYIISKLNTYLHASAEMMSAWLGDKLPRVSDTWWNDCVISSLTYAQREIAEERGFTKLGDFDLAALLRIANKSWYDLRTVFYLPTSERECIRRMMTVRNNWAHCSAELPGKDTILNDLSILSEYFTQMNADTELKQELEVFTTEMEKPDSIRITPAVHGSSNHGSNSAAVQPQPGEIQVNSLVYLVGDPSKNGVVYTITDLGGILKYDVFMDNRMQTFYTGQIALVGAVSGYQWLDLDVFRSYLTAYQINNPSAQNLYSLNAARIDFVPYQFRPALKMIHADEPRILVADSVGVGKTIEAGLIIKELEARQELERVLVICPRPLVAERKWELEMKRFDEDFIPVDGQTLRQIISDTDRDGQWPARYDKLIIPYSVLDRKTYEGDDNSRRVFGLTELDPEPHFDLVIVDEAHHIRNGSMEKEKAYAYKCTKYFCDHADAVVMLTATPLQTSDRDLFTLLNVLRPDVVIDESTFNVMAKPNEYISRAVHQIRCADENWAANASNALLAVRKTQWGDNVVSENPLYDDILERLEQDEITREERVQLISDVESLHSFSTMINRTRRRDIQDFCIRRPHTISTVFTESQRELHDKVLVFETTVLGILHDPRTVPFMISTIRRQTASCIFGLAPFLEDMVNNRLQQLIDDPDADYGRFEIDSTGANPIKTSAEEIIRLAHNLPEEDPKFEATLRIIQEKQSYDNNKIMLFSTFRHTLAYLKTKLTAQGIRVEQIDGSVKDDKRYEMKARFELPKDDPDALDMLLFTEVGSEGLDYQFCDTMINYDLPWNPMRIEQRIGRIDRRGQVSESVNIYNIITEDTVDADIYYRCLDRIGIFENSIGECEAILGEIASNISSIVTDTTLTEAERRIKLEQMADNEVRKIQEVEHLEEEEKELFGFDLSEFTTSQEIRRAENPWLTPIGLQRLIEQYFHDRLETGATITGESALKNLRISATARGKLRDDLRKLPGTRNAVRRTWDNYLSGNKPNHPITFEADAAEKNRDSFFITAMHPLAKQAAAYFERSEAVHLKLHYFTTTIPAGVYRFSTYAWKYTGFTTTTNMVTVSDQDQIAEQLSDILESAINDSRDDGTDYDWAPMEAKEVQLWLAARDAHKRDARTTINFKLESLENTFGNLKRTLQQQILDATDESIRRMKQSELENKQAQHDSKVAELKEMATKADIYVTLLAKGVIIVSEG